MRLGLTYKNEEHIFDENVVNGVPYLSYPLLEETGAVKHGFSTKLGGVSTGNCATMNISTTRGDDPEAVAENRRRIGAAIGVRPEDMTYTHQTHTTNVAVVRDEDRGRRFLETDGMVTNVPGICLVTFYADCVPLFLVDPVKKGYWPEPFRMERDGGQDGKGHRAGYDEGIWLKAGRHRCGHRPLHLSGLL